MNSQPEEEQPPLSREDLSGSQVGYNQNNDDERLRYAMITLNVDELIHLFTENNITFVDLLLLSKEDLSELRLPLYQRNRIWNFSQKFNAYAKSYSMGELTDFFLFNKQFIFNPTVVERITANSQGFSQSNNNNNYQLTGSFNLSNNHNNNLNEGSSSNNNNNITNVPYENGNALAKEGSNCNNEGIVNKEDNDSSVHNTSKKENTKQKDKYKEPTQNEEGNDDNLMLHINQNDNTKYKQEQRFQNKKNSNKLINKQSNDNNIKGSTASPEYEPQIPKKKVKKNLSSNTAYKKYIETKKEADKILEQLSKLKEDQESKHHKYQILMKRSSKGSSGGFGSNGTYGNSNYNNYEERNEQEYTGEEEENELQNEYDKMASKIEEIEKMKMDYNTFTCMNKIKNHVINKGDNITLEDIYAVNEKLATLEEVINKKELLKQNLQDKKNSIEKTKHLLNDIENNNHNHYSNYNQMEEYSKQNDRNDVNEVEEVQEEYEQESEEPMNYKEHSI